MKTVMPIYSIDINSKLATLKKTFFYQNVPLKCLIEFNLNDYIVSKDSEKYNL